MPKASNIFVDEVGIELPKQTKLTEIVQTKALKFGLMVKSKEKVFRCFHPLVKCRDYFSDIIHFKAMNLPFSTYGMRIEPTDNLLDLDTTRLLIKMPNASAFKAFVQNFEIISEYETSALKVDPARLFAIKEDPNAVMLEADPFWQKSTQLFALLTFMCRCICYLEKPSDDWTKLESDGVDGRYLAAMRQSGVFKTVLNHLPKLDFDKSPTPSGWNKDVGVDYVHGYSGIFSFIVGLGKDDGHMTHYIGTMKANAFARQIKDRM